MVWGTEKGGTCLPIVAVQIQDPQLALEQMLMVPLGSTVGSYTVPCMSLQTPASPLHPGYTPGPESQHTQSPVPRYSHVNARHGDAVTRHQTRTNQGAPRGQGIPWLAREGGRQPDYLESRDLDPSHPRKPALCLAQAEAPSPQPAGDTEPRLGHLPIHAALTGPLAPHAGGRGLW